MYSFDQNNKSDSELEKRIAKLDNDLKEYTRNFFENLLQKDFLTKWSFQDEKIICILNEDLKEYFENLSLCLFKEDDLPQKLIELFISDVKVAVLKDEAFSISRKVSKKENNEQFRSSFDTLSTKNFFINNVENMETKLYLKSLHPFVKLTFHYSKKKSSTLLERFNGFKLINAKISKDGELKVYRDTIEMLKEFIFSFENNIYSALSIAFFDEKTDFLDIHHLAMKKYEKESSYSVKDYDLCLKILTEVRTPLMKRILMDYHVNLKEERLIELLKNSLAVYNQLLEKCKQELEFFLNKNIKNDLKKDTVYTKVKRYETIYDLLGNDMNYEDLLEDLKDELEGLTEVETSDPVAGEFITKEWLIRNVFKKTVTYDIHNFGQSYVRIYKEKKQK